MYDYEWHDFIIKKKSISEEKLKMLPVIKTCDNWKKVLPLGLVSHSTGLSTYKGGVIEYGNKIYFMRKETMIALQKELKFNFPAILKITQES